MNGLGKKENLISIGILISTFLLLLSPAYGSGITPEVESGSAALGQTAVENRPASPSRNQIESEAVVTQVSPTLKMVLTSTDGLKTMSEIADSIKELIDIAPINHTIVLVFKPTDNNASKYKELWAEISSDINKAKAEKNLRIYAEFVNPSLSAEAFSVAAESNKTDLTGVSLRLKEEGLIVAEDLPHNFVERLDRNSSIFNNVWVDLKQTGRSLLETGKTLSFSGIAVASVLTATGAATIGPSWVYVSSGEWTGAAIASAAMSTALLYTIPRNESLTRKIYEFGYEFIRSGWQIARYSGNRVNFASDRRFYLSEKNPLGFEIFRASAASTLYAIPLQLAFYTLQDGNEVWNPEYLDFIFRNSVLIGLASSPWSFVTEKLKADTYVSENLINNARTLHLLGIGALAIGIPYGVEAEFYKLNSMQEALLIGSGALGLLANKYAVRLVNKLDKNLWSRFFHRNFQAVTDTPDNFLKNLFRRVSGKDLKPYNYASMARIKNEFFGQTSVPVNQCYRYLTTN